MPCGIYIFIRTQTMFVSVLFGATVRLFYNGSIVENTWLDSGVGTNTEITGSDGQYNFVLNGNASSGTYTLEVEPPSGYIFESTDIPAETTSYEPNLGAGEESIQTQETAPTTSETTTYYLSFSFTIENVAAETSNGVIHNHIPVDPIAASGKELVNKVKAPLTKVLKQDFHDTVSGQMNDFSNIARQSVRRLEKNNIKYCEDTESNSSLDEVKLLKAIGLGQLNEKYERVNGNCKSNRNTYTDVQYKITTSSKVGIQYLLQVNQTQEFKVLTTSIKCLRLLPNLSSFQTTRVSPSRKNDIAFSNPGRSVLAPLAVSLNI